MNLAGAFRGLGVGLTQASQFQLQQQAEERREQALLDRQTALANAEAQAREAAAEKQAVRDRETNRLKIVQQANADIGKVVAVQPIKDKERKEQQAFQVKMAYIQGSIAQSNAAAAAKLSHLLSSGDVVDTKVGGDGNYYIVHKNGTVENTGVAAPPDSKVDFQGVNDTGDLVVGRSDGSVSTVEGVRPKPSESLFGGMPGAVPTAAKPDSGGVSPRPIKVTTQGGAQEQKPPRFKEGDIAIDSQGRKIRLNAAGRWIPVR